MFATVFSDHDSAANRAEVEQELHHLVHHLDLGVDDLPRTLLHPHLPQLHHLEQTEAGQAEHERADSVCVLRKINIFNILLFY